MLRRLDLDPRHITRLGEPVAVELGILDSPRDEPNRDRWIEALAAHPSLIQRPIITADDGTATVARTPEAVRQALSPTSGNA